MRRTRWRRRAVSRRRSEGSERVQQDRALRAWAGIMALLALSVILLARWSDQGMPGPLEAEGSRGSLVAAMAYGSEDSRSALLGGAGFSGVEENPPPSWFSEEILDPSSVAEILSVEDWALVRVSWRSDTTIAMGHFDAELDRRGWVCVSGHESLQRTYMKEKGRCRWLAVACAGTESGASAVMHIQHD